ncbi:hypothetical protein D3C72_1862750 [compost metagenome]
MLALHGDAVDQRVEAGPHGVEDSRRGILAGQFDEQGLLLSRLGERGIDAAPFFGRLVLLAFAGIFQLARQAQPGAHDLVIDPRQGGDLVQEFVAGRECFAGAAQPVDADGRQAGDQGADREQRAQDHATDGDVFQKLCHARRPKMQRVCIWTTARPE